MTTHVVIANEGNISNAMSYRRALRHAKRLRRLGNYRVWITEVQYAPNYQG